MKSFAFDCAGKIERMRHSPAVKAAASRYQEKKRKQSIAADLFNM